MCVIDMLYSYPGMRESQMGRRLVGYASGGVVNRGNKMEYVGKNRWEKR